MISGHKIFVPVELLVLAPTGYNDNFYCQRESNLEGLSHKTVRVIFLPKPSTLQKGGSELSSQLHDRSRFKYFSMFKFWTQAAKHVEPVVQRVKCNQ